MREEVKVFMSSARNVSESESYGTQSQLEYNIQRDIILRYE